MRSRIKYQFFSSLVDHSLCIDSTDVSIKMASSSTITLQRFLICSAVLVLLVHRTFSVPIDEALLRCQPGTARRNICEKCAKVTRDSSAFDLCCTQEGDQQWCEDFINFTLRP